MLNVVSYSKTFKGYLAPKHLKAVDNRPSIGFSGFQIE